MTRTSHAVVVGSLHYDIVVKAPHRPAAGETVTGSRWHPAFGGKGGNQAVAIVTAGVPCRMVAALGDDDFGSFLLRHLEARQVDTTYVETLSDSGSGMSVAIMDASGDYGAVIVSGSNLRIDPATLDQDELWQDASLLVLQNEVLESLNIAAARAARTRNIQVVLNAAPARPISDEMAGLVDILVVNAGEAEALCDISVENLGSARHAAAALASRFRIVVVTAGGAGVAVAGTEGAHSEPSHKVKLVSTHGAGDCFIGTMVASLARGVSLASSVAEANLAAARHVSAEK
ncbi:PfkB family carbohydrate kinase [Paracoccus pantotrophus]|nr:PfkB family carbohydrate kinase [Paracoccus pantotrophus]RDD97774.1 ribokinase [Paracoccus pantotrophus]WGR66339.1 ribokinase [Paracoccus pantotrophus]